MSQIFVAPGNAGTRLEPNTTNVDIAADDVPALLAFARQENIDLTIVGPEAPLVIGLCDTFAAAGLRCFGPSKLAARLEGSKAFTKDFLKRHAIPTAAYAKFTRDNFDAAWIRAQQAPLVVKADGLAAGKGVVICATTDEAVATAQDMFAGRFGKAGDLVVVEEFLEGEEASFIAMVDGTTVLPLATSQDHKRLRDADEGPNTGGMGAYSPAPVVTPEMHERIMREVMLPTVAALAREGTPYLGFLYAGVMIHPDGTPNVLEFNCRFGDPETQPILARMRSDLVVAVRSRARWQARRRRSRLGSARRGWCRDGRRRLSGRRAQGRRNPRPRRGGEDAGQGLPRRHDAECRGQGGDERRTRTVRRRPRQDRARRAETGLRTGRHDLLGRAAVPQGHRLPRDRAGVVAPQRVARGLPGDRGRVS